MISEIDIERIVNWLDRASYSAPSSSEETRARLRSTLLNSPLEFLHAHIHHLPASLLALLPLSPAERGSNQTIASRRRMYARIHAPEELRGAGSKERLGGLWMRYSEGKASVQRVEEERDRRVRRREREEARRRARARSAGVTDRESVVAEPEDLVGVAEERHPTLSEYFDGADDPRAAADEARQNGVSQVGAEAEGEEEVEDDEDEEADEDEFDTGDSATSPATGEDDGFRAPPDTTGDIAISTFERYAISLFVAGTDDTLPRSLYDSVDFDERWDAVEVDQDPTAGATVPSSSGDRSGRLGSMRGLTAEDAYFDADD